MVKEVQSPVFGGRVYAYAVYVFNTCVCTRNPSAQTRSAKKGTEKILRNVFC